MKSIKITIILLFCFSIILFFIIDLTIQQWIILAFIFLGLSFLNILFQFYTTLPFCSIIGLVFLLENVIALIFLFLLDNKRENDIEGYYCQVPIINYLPYALLSCQAYLVGSLVVKKKASNWVLYIKNFNKLISKNTLLFIIGIGLSSALLYRLNISAIGFVAYIFSNLSFCALVGFYLSGKGKQGNLYLFVGVLINLVSVVLTGMFTGFTMFLILVGIIFFEKKIISNSKKNWFLYFIFGAISIVFFAFLQNLKGDYRSQTWGDEIIVNEKSKSTIFYDNALKGFNSIDVSNKDFYFPLLHRMNQGWLVSCTMEKVPEKVPFENGATIFNAAFDALLPRFINSSKQVHGNDRIKKYTNLHLSQGTAMGIGYLGEAYVNFGKIGGIICVGLFGFFVSYLEKKVLESLESNPIALLVFPLFFMQFISSGNDFFWFFNTITMGSLIIYILIKYLKNKNVEWLKIDLANKKSSIYNT